MSACVCVECVCCVSSVQLGVLLVTCSLLLGGGFLPRDRVGMLFLSCFLLNWCHRGKKKKSRNIGRR